LIIFFRLISGLVFSFMPFTIPITFISSSFPVVLLLPSPSVSLLPSHPSFFIF
jgi:hypothetical protein